jgi:hypothetical protein
MALVLDDRVKETSTTTGTGTLDLDGVVSGFQTFVAGIGSTNTCFYAIVHRSAAEWEVGVGTVTDAAPDTLARTTIISSSNGDAAVNFSAGTKDVICTLPSSKIPIGQQTIWVPAAAMEPAVTTAAATSNAIEIGTSLFAARTMDFATDADDFAYFAVQMPKGWDGGALIYQFLWSATGQTSGLDSVVWSIAAVGLASSDVLTTAFPTPTALTLQEHSATNDDIMITAESPAVTPNGTPAGEEFVMFEVSRDISADDLSVDARLHGIKIHYNIDTGNDN